MSLAPSTSSQSQLIHPRRFIIPILCRIAQRLSDRSLLFRQRPDNAFAGRKRIRLSAEDWISEGFLGVDQLPAFALEHLDQIAEKQSIQQIEVHQDCVLHGSTSNFLSQRIIVVGAVPHVLEIKIT